MSQIDIFDFKGLEVRKDLGSFSPNFLFVIGPLDKDKDEQGEREAWGRDNNKRCLGRGTLSLKVAWKRVVVSSIDLVNNVAIVIIIIIFRWGCELSVCCRSGITASVFVTRKFRWHLTGTITFVDRHDKDIMCFLHLGILVPNFLNPPKVKFGCS
jgi:hypothetical protein